MDDTNITTLDHLRSVLASSSKLIFKGRSRAEKYAWLQSVLKRFDYFNLQKKSKGLVKSYLERMSGFSRAQVTRLIERSLLEGEIKPKASHRNCFPPKYTRKDKELLAQTDNAHGRLSGPATRKILQRAYTVYGDKSFERLGTISSSHIYNLRKSRSYRQGAQTMSETRSVSRAIEIRRRPEPQGRPGYIRVDTVHQGDLDGKKGVYHVNLVDAVFQWEIVVCVEAISAAYLEPVLEEALLAFPFRILGFHSDNGSEFINVNVSKLLNDLLIEQTKSRSGHTNDNALVEGKNGSVIRKHMGHWHIDQKHAPAINRFYQRYFNPYLNFHRPCGFATVTVDTKGKRHKKYETYQTPHDRLKSFLKTLSAQDVINCLREGVSLKRLEAIAEEETDNKSAQRMQKAKGKLFRKLGEKGCKLMGSSTAAA